MSRLFIVLFMAVLSVNVMEQSSNGLYYYKAENRMAHQMCRPHDGVCSFWVDNDNKCKLVILCKDGTLHTDMRESNEKEGRICK
jgi:hypothetical protein